MSALHKGRRHVYHKRKNPAGCDKFYCLHRYRRLYYWFHTIGTKGGWRCRGEG